MLDVERLPRLAGGSLQAPHAVAVVGVEVLDEEPGMAVPLRPGVAEDGLDLGADEVRRLVGRVRGVDVRDQRQLLDEGAVAGLGLVPCRRGEPDAVAPATEVRQDPDRDRGGEHRRDAAAAVGDADAGRREEQVPDDVWARPV